MSDRAYPAQGVIRMGRIAACLAGCVGVFLLGHPLPAVAQITWTGSTSTAWTNGANWEGGAAPTAATTAVFGATLAGNQPSLTSGTVAGLRFDRPEGGWTVSISGVLSLAGANVNDSLNTSGTTTLSGGIIRLDAGVDKTWTVGLGGTIRVTDAISFTGNPRVLNVVGGLVSANRLIGGNTVPTEKGGDGTLLITGSSSSIQNFELTAGTLILGDPFALGNAGSNVLYMTPGSRLQASVDLTGTNFFPKELSVRTGAAAVISGTQSMEMFLVRMQSNTGNAVLENSIVAGKTLTIRALNGNYSNGSRLFTIQGSGSTIISGSITNGPAGASGFSQSYTKAGTGVLTIDGIATYSGSTTVSGGVLMLSTTAAVSGTAPRTYAVQGGGALATGFAADQAFLGRIQTSSLGTIALGANSETSLDFSSASSANLSFASLGAFGPVARVYSGTLTPNGTTYRIGGGGGTLDFQGPLSGGNALVVGGNSAVLGGAVILSGTAHTFTGKTTLQAGSLEIASIADSGTTNPSSLGAPTTANATIDIGASGGSGTQTLRYVGTGHSTNRTLNLLNTTGGLVLDASGSGTVAFTGGVVSATALTLTLTGSNTGGNYITAVTGSNVFKTGVGTWVLGSNSFTGQLVVQQGTIVAAMDAPGGSGTSSALGKQNGPIPVIGLVDASGTAALLAANGVTISRVIEVAALGSGDQEVVLGGSGAGTATFDGNSAFRLGRGVTLAADPGGNVRFSTPTANWDKQDGSTDPAVAVTIGTPTATGTVTLETTLPNSITAVTVRQGTLRLGNGTTVGALGPSSVLSGSAGATLAFDRSDTISSGVHFASAIGGALNVRQQGSGTVVLAGVNTYTGATDVVAGTLEVDGVLGNTAVTVAAGATLSGTGTIGGPTTILGTHAPGSSPGIETFTNGLTYGATSTLVWELIANTASPGSRGVLFDGVDLTGGALSIVNGATLSLVFDLPGSTVDWDNAFWGTNRAWTIIDVAGGSWNSSLFTLQVGVDSTSASLTSKRPDSLFQIVDQGGDLVLEYVIVPEPGALALAGFGLAAAWGYHRRRRAQTRVR